VNVMIYFCFSWRITRHSYWQHVLCTLCSVKEGSAGPRLACGSLGQEVDESSYLCDEHRSQCCSHHVTRGLFPASL